MSVALRSRPLATHPSAALPFARALLLFLSTLCLGTTTARAFSCPVATAHAPTDAEQAYLRGEFDHAATLYQTQLQQQPAEPHLIAGFSLVLLRQQKIDDAEALVRKALPQNPNSAILLTALGEVQFRQGLPWLASTSADKALRLDPCYPRVRLLEARLYHLNSYYASSAKEISTAYALDPHDPDIHRQWLNTLPPARRIAELEAYLASDTGDDPDQIRHLHTYLDFLKKQQVTPHKACRLISPIPATEIQFAQLMHDATHVRAFGLDVKLNDHNARLQIDTGASGLVISRSVAEHAGLQRFTSNQAGGIGSKGEVNAYTAYADSIKIGGLEFHDCEVEVLDQRNVVDSDGLIGMDVFSRFLVKLDYPMRKLALSPLPKRPDDVTPVTPTLETAQSASDDPPVASESTPTSPSTPAASPAKPPPIARNLHDRYVDPTMKDWTPVYRVGHQLLIPTSLNQTERRLFILDTGAFTTSISPAVARTITKVRTNDHMTVHGISGKVDEVFSADQVEFRFSNIVQKGRDVVSFENPSISKNTGLEVAGFIGATTLGQVTMTIDYRDGLVRFDYDPNRGYRHP